MRLFCLWLFWWICRVVGAIHGKEQHKFWQIFTIFYSYPELFQMDHCLTSVFLHFGEFCVFRKLHSFHSISNWFVTIDQWKFPTSTPLNFLIKTNILQLSISHNLWKLCVCHVGRWWTRVSWISISTALSAQTPAAAPSLTCWSTTHASHRMAVGSTHPPQLRVRSHIHSLQLGDIVRKLFLDIFQAFDYFPIFLFNIQYLFYPLNWQGTYLSSAIILTEQLLLQIKFKSKKSSQNRAGR